MKAPSIAVCLTSYKRGHVISKTIESILAQDYSDFEFVISDDASDDQTEEVCRDFERKDSRVRFIRHSTNIGMPANLREAISATTAPLIANLHDGDTFRPNLLSKWKAALDTQPEASFVFCQVVHLDEKGNHQCTRAPNLPNIIPQFELVRFMLSQSELFDSPVWGTVMGRRSAYASVGGFDARYSFISDVAMWIRLNLLSPAIYVKEPLIFLHKGELDRPFAYTNWALAIAAVSIYEEAVERLYAGDPVKIAQERKRLHSARDVRWLKAAGSCVKRDHLRQVEEAIEVFANDDSSALRSASLLLRAYLPLRKRYPRIYPLVNRAVEVISHVR